MSEKRDDDAPDGVTIHAPPMKLTHSVFHAGPTGIALGTAEWPAPTSNPIDDIRASAQPRPLQPGVITGKQVAALKAAGFGLTAFERLEAAIGRHRKWLENADPISGVDMHEVVDAFDAWKAARAAETMSADAPAEVRTVPPAMPSRWLQREYAEGIRSAITPPRPADPLTPDPPPDVLRSLWYIAPLALRKAAVDAAARAEPEEPTDDIFTDPAPATPADLTDDEPVVPSRA